MPNCKRFSTQRPFTIICVILLSACQAFQHERDLTEDQGDLQTVLERDRRLEAATADEALEKARAAWQAGQSDLAQALYVKAFNLDPGNIAVLEDMAQVYRKLDKPDLAEMCYKLILQKQPDNPSVLERYGLLLLHGKKWPEAEQTLRKVLEADPKNWKALNGLGIIADIQSKHDQALDFFAQADKLKPNDPEILNNIGYSLYMNERLPEAQNLFLRALKIKPDFKKALYNYGLVEARKRRYPEALSVFSKVMSAPQANNNTGYIAMMNGDYAEADHYLNQAVKLSPKFYEKAAENLNELEMRKLKGPMR